MTKQATSARDYSPLDLIGFDEIPPRGYRAHVTHTFEPTHDDTAYGEAVAAFEAELEALHFGPIGADDCPPPSLATKRPSKRSRRAARRRVAASQRREPGSRAIRRVLRRAVAAGATTAPTLRAWISHEFATVPSKARRERLVAEFATTPEPMYTR